MRGAWLGIGVALVATGSFAASKSRRVTPPPASVVAQNPGNLAAPSSESLSSNESSPAKVHGSRKQEGIDVPVFVDGKQRATLRYGELPRELEPFAPEPTTVDGSLTTTPTRTAPRLYRLADYLAAVGVPLRDVRAVHLRGNGFRVASITGDELRADRERFVFDFMQRETGIAKTRWDTTGLANAFRVDEIRALFVFVDKGVPTLDPRRSCYLETVKGEPSPICSEKIPYADEEPAKGTRVYVDGRLVGQVKRRRLGESVVVGKDESGQTRFGLTELLRSFGVDPHRAKGVELVAGDDVIARGTDLQKHERELSFVLGAHRHGRVQMNVPASWQAPQGADPHRATEVTAVLLFESKPPTSKRTLTPLPDVPPPEESARVVAEGDG